MRSSGLVDAVIDGERVLLATKAPSEKTFQLQLVAKLSTMGIRVLQHRIFPCHTCGARPMKSCGLGTYASDLVCVVPPYGRVVFLELKRKGKKNQKRDAEQREWLKWIRHYGGVADTVDNIDDALRLIDLARRLPL